MSAKDSSEVFNCVSYNDVISLRNICMLARKHQYNLEELDKFGNTPLLKACYLGRLECVCILLEFGADIYTINYFGQNALTLATYGGYFPIVLELLQRRSYQDFNLSSLIPAICVATMRQHYALEDYFMRLDQNSTQEIHTVHGLSVYDLRQMVKSKIKNKHARALKPTLFFNH